MFSEHKADCLICQEPAERRFSANFRIARPLVILQEQPHGQPVEVGRYADSADSADRNPDIPPDYPNLTV